MPCRWASVLAGWFETGSRVAPKNHRSANTHSFAQESQQMTHFVVPQKDVLDDSGCVWESMLMYRGWNNLSTREKTGRIVQAYTDGTIDVHFDALDYTATGVYIDELKPAPADGER